MPTCCGWVGAEVCCSLLQCLDCQVGGRGHSKGHSVHAIVQHWLVRLSTPQEPMELSVWRTQQHIPVHLADVPRESYPVGPEPDEDLVQQSGSNYQDVIQRSGRALAIKHHPELGCRTALFVDSMHWQVVAVLHCSSQFLPADWLSMSQIYVLLDNCLELLPGSLVQGRAFVCSVVLQSLASALSQLRCLGFPWKGDHVLACRRNKYMNLSIVFFNSWLFWLAGWDGSSTSQNLVRAWLGLSTKVVTVVWTAAWPAARVSSAVYSLLRAHPKTVGTVLGVPSGPALSSLERTSLPKMFSPRTRSILPSVWNWGSASGKRLKYGRFLTKLAAPMGGHMSFQAQLLPLPGRSNLHCELEKE